MYIPCRLENVTHFTGLNMRNTRKAVELEARGKGLFLSYYNPGDNPTFKLATVDADYFAVSSSETVGRFKTLKQVRKFLAKREG